MRLQHECRSGAGRRGAALLLSLLVLFVLVAIVFQINVTTGTDARMARNDVGLTSMDLAIESALLQVFEELEQDGQASGGGASALAPGEGGGGEDGGPSGGAGESSEPSDSHEDEWGRPQQTSFDEMDVRLRILVQDEDSKFNVLAMISEDEDEAEEAFERVVRILDMCREDTEADIDRGEAERKARAMREHMERRRDSALPFADQLSFDQARADVGLPLTLREFAALEPFTASDFRDFRDRNGTVVHSIGSFLTVWTSLRTQSEGAGGEGVAGGQPGAENDPGGGAPGEGGGGGEPGAGGGDPNDLSQGPGELTGGSAGYSVNVNTAPPAVLKALFSDSEVPSRFWDEVIHYRDTEEEDEEKDQDAEPVYDEFGEEVVPLQIFDKPSELTEIDGWLELDSAVRQRIGQLVRTQSQVFSIFITAIRSTGIEDGSSLSPEGTRDAFERGQGNQLVRTVRCVVWRRTEGEEVKIVPIVRWEVLDYVPFEVQDIPEEDR